MRPKPLRALDAAKSSLAKIRERHAARHRSTGLGFVFADSIDYLDTHRWDEITSDGSVWMRRDVLRAIEVAGPANMTPRYAMVFKDGKVVAAVAAQIVQVTGDQLPSGNGKPAKSGKGENPLLKRLIQPAQRLAKKHLNERLLVAGNLLCWGFHGIALAEDADLDQVWTAIGEALYRIRRAERLTGQTNFVMVKD